MFGEEDELQPSGKVFKKLLLGPYQWTSYDQADQVVTCTVMYCTLIYCTVLYQVVTAFGAGVRSLGLQPRQPVCIYAETRQVAFILQLLHAWIHC